MTRGDRRTLHDRGGRPDLSVVLVSPGGYEGILPTFYDIADQTVADRIELIVTTPCPDDFELEGKSYARLHSLQVVDAGDFKTRGQAAAPGILNARAPVIALTENHAFPTPDWAELILAAHAEPWTGVTPYVEIENPETLWSRIASFMDYGYWIGQANSGESPAMPWHNSTYKREPLLALGEELFTLLEPENQLQDRLRAQGHRFFIERRARIRHVGSSTARIAILSALGRGREFAVVRSRNWSPPRRLLYAVSWPLFPLIRLVKLRDQISKYRRHYAVAPLMPGILLLLGSASFGECLGYLTGMGASEDYLLKHELDFAYRVSRREHREILRRVEDRRRNDRD